MSAPLSPSRILPRLARLGLVAGSVAIPAAIASEPFWGSPLYGPGWTSAPASSFYDDKILQDFSYAGYRRGEVPIPAESPGATYDVVADYGADPGGTTDSTLAIQAAIDAASAAGGGTVWMPPGTYLLSPQEGTFHCLRIAASGVRLRGAGLGETFLLNTEWAMREKHLLLVEGPSNSAWTSRGSASVAISEDLLSPTTLVPVSSTAAFSVGDFVMLRAEPGDAWALDHLEPDWAGAPANSFGRLLYPRQVVAVDPAGGTLRLDIPTRYALKTRDGAEVYKLREPVSEVGLEGFSIGNRQHPGSTGWGENDYQTAGTPAYEVFNHDAIRFLRVRDSWIREVSTFQPVGNGSTCHILNNGIRLIFCHRVTVSRCHLQRPQYGGGGGSGYLYRIQNSAECLLEHCSAEFSRHGIVLSSMGASGNVIHACLDKTTGKQTGHSGNQDTSGRGSDHHMHFSHSNLHDLCVAEDSWFEARYRPFGGATKHNLTSAHGVYWNTEGRPSSRTYVVHSQQSRYGYVVGTRGAVPAVKLDGSSPEKTDPVDHAEGIAEGDRLRPHSLFLEQRRRRIGLPAFEEGATTELFFPHYNAVLAMPVSFGDLESTPTDASFSWEQTEGPAPATLVAPEARETEVRFARPGLYEFRVAAWRHGSQEGDFAAGGRLRVRVLPRGWERLALEPEADAYVRNGEPDTNFNTTSLWMKTVSSNSVNREIFMRFDLRPLQPPPQSPDPPARRVREATLVMRATDPDRNPDFGALAESRFVADDAWSESGITWNTRPAAGPSLGTWILSPEYVQRLDLTEPVATEVSGDGRISMRHAVLSQRTSATVFKYASREHPDPVQRPRLDLLLSPDTPDFATWIAGFSEIPPSLRGPGDDFDGDGRSNYEEYALDTSPLQPDPGPALRLERNQGGTLWHLRLRGGASLRDTVHPVAEHSPDLSPGSWRELSPMLLAVEGEDLLLSPFESDESGRGFFRVRYLEVEVDSLML